MTDKIRLNLYVDSEVKEKIKANADKMGLTMNGYINVCIADYMRQGEAMDFMKFAEQIKNMAERNIKPGE